MLKQSHKEALDARISNAKPRTIIPMTKEEMEYIKSVKGKSCRTCNYYDPYVDHNPFCDMCNLYSNYKNEREEVRKEIEERRITGVPMWAKPQNSVVDGSAQSSEHYKVNKVQPIEFMQLILTPEEFIGFLKGNVIKYTTRCGKKDDPVKEAAKIEQYSKWLLQALKGEIINPRL